MEISSGIRVMQTFRKLPTIIPKRKKKKGTMTTVCPATPRPLFPICHTPPTASTHRTSARASSLTLLLRGLCELRGLYVSSFLRHAAAPAFLFLEPTTVNLKLATASMHWFERKIRRYEHRRWTTDDNRRVQPFHWGLEHIGGSPDDPNPAAFVRDYSRRAIESSMDWYAASPAPDYRLDRENVLTFTSSIASPWPENNTVHAQLFPGRQSIPSRFSSNHSGHAVLLLPNWNAKWHGQNGLCHWIQRMGITVLKMSMPYHDRRMAHGHERADQICGPNIGLTLQANRQAVQDARRCLHWLEQQGYTNLGILGTSIGSSVGYITLVHDERIRAGGFFHVSTYYADV